MLLILHQFAHALGLKEYFLKFYYKKRMLLQNHYQAQDKTMYQNLKNQKLTNYYEWLFTFAWHI